MGQGNVFTGVRLSTGGSPSGSGGVCLGLGVGGFRLGQGKKTPQTWTEPTGQQADATHPTGMLSCVKYLLKSTKIRAFSSMDENGIKNVTHKKTPKILSAGSFAQLSTAMTSVVFKQKIQFH